jgi:hypothetical protein
VSLYFITWFSLCQIDGCVHRALDPIRQVPAKQTWAVNLLILSSFFTVLFCDGTLQALCCSNQHPKDESPLILLCDAKVHCVGHQSYRVSTSLAGACGLVHQIRQVGESHVISHDVLYLNEASRTMLLWQ